MLLILILIFSLIFGFAVGISCCVGRIFKQMRKIVMLRKECSVLDGDKLT